MKETCETCGKEVEAEPHEGGGFAIYFCSRKCEREMEKVMENLQRPVRKIVYPK